MKKDLSARNWIDDKLATATALRQRATGYTGLAATFKAIEERLQADFKLSGAVTHPGDKGTARENLLRTFLATEGYLPRRFALADASSHVLSTTGHISAQVDLLLYDALSTPRLLSVGGIHYFPIESCYGMIESKSDLASRDVVRDGLDKIAAFKKLRVCRGRSPAPSEAFGVLVGYTASLQWTTVIEAIKEWQEAHDAQLWPNLVVVLDQGAIGHVHERGILLHTPEIAEERGSLAPVAIKSDVLLHFYLLLVDLLNRIELVPTPLRSYVRLPLTEGTHSYRFAFGPVSETGACAKHGPFLRQITNASLERILAASPDGSEVDGTEQLDAVYGKAFGARGGPGMVRIYNPDKLSPQQILVRPAVLGDARGLSLSYEPVLIDGYEHWLPLFYVFRDALITSCPRCAKTADLSQLTIEEWWADWEARVQETLEKQSAALEKAPEHGEK